MPDKQTLEAMTSPELIREVVAVPLRFKIIANILKSRPADSVAGEALIAAFDRGNAPPWLTAYLLGCLRARVGYSTVRDILVAAPGLLAESYAGVAMHAILEQGAFADLAHLILEGLKLPTREGAAYGLGQFNTAAAAEAVSGAAASGKIRPSTAGGILARLPFDDERVAEFVLSTDERTRRIGTETARSRGHRWRSAGQSPPRILVVAVSKLLLSPEVSMAPQTRRNLADWFRSDTRPSTRRRA